MMLFLCGKGPALQEILLQCAEQGHKVALFTHPGEPIAKTAHQLGIWYSTHSVNVSGEWPFMPGAIASIGYLTIIRQPVIDAVQGRVFNCHAALLPNHRGRSSVPWAILDGDRITGITYHWIDAGIDTGKILLQGTCDITPDETQDTLWQKIHRLIVMYWPAAVKLAFQDMPGVAQKGPSKYHQAGPPHSGVIDPNWPWDYIERFIRAMVYPPLPYATYNGHEVRTIEEYADLRRAERLELAL